MSKFDFRIGSMDATTAGLKTPTAPLQGLDLLTHGVKTPNTPNPANTESLWSQNSLFGEQGWAMPALQGVGLASSLGFGFMNLRESRKNRNEQKRQFNKNFNMQSNMLEQRVRDRHASQLAYGVNPRHETADDAINEAFKRK